MIFHLDRYLKPDIYSPNLEAIDFESLFNRGYRLALIDVDNTLARHGSFEADAYARRAISRAIDAGFACRIVSNAGKNRIQAYAATLGIPYVAWAQKPSIKALVNACQASGIGPAKTVMIGDQILTDIVSAHRAGCLAILVDPRSHHEGFQIRVKRWIEKVLFRRSDLSDHDRQKIK